VQLATAVVQARRKTISFTALSWKDKNIVADAIKENGRTWSGVLVIYSRPSFLPFPFTRGTTLFMIMAFTTTF
jgi:hypothetical protein